MSYFNAPQIARNADIKKIQSYAMLLNQQLQYCLSNIDPEDNFSLETMVKYQETDEMIAQLEVNMGGFLSEFKNLESGVGTSIKVLNDQIALKVGVDEICSEISMTAGNIAFKTGYITIDAKNFKLLMDGSAEFSGAITGGSININNKFIVDSSGHTEIASGAYTGQISCSGPLATETLITYGDCSVEGTISCNQMSASGSVTCEVLYQDSDRRLKEAIRDIPDKTALDVVLGLEPVIFEYCGSGVQSMGFVAQDVNRMQEQLGTDLPMTDMGEDGYYRIPYANYGALYAGAIRQQQKEIEELERMIA